MKPGSFSSQPPQPRGYPPKPWGIHACCWDPKDSLLLTSCPPLNPGLHPEALPHVPIHGGSTKPEEGHSSCLGHSISHFASTSLAALKNPAWSWRLAPTGPSHWVSSDTREKRRAWYSEKTCTLPSLLCVCWHYHPVPFVHYLVNIHGVLQRFFLWHSISLYAQQGCNQLTLSHHSALWWLQSLSLDWHTLGSARIHFWFFRFAFAFLFFFSYWSFLLSFMI